MKRLELWIEGIIFSSRWLQVPIYLGLVVGSGLYALKFIKELIHLCSEVQTMPEASFMLGILTLIDISMVLNLMAMVTIGGFATFVSRMQIHEHEDRPDWLEKIDAGTLKVKLAGALVGISGIELLKVFINIANHNLEQVKWQVIIHLVFLLSVVMLAYAEKILAAKKA